jgi:hypothetical protein
VTAPNKLAELRKLQASPAEFRNVLLIDSDGGAQRLSAVCDPWQRTDFERLDGGWRAVAGHKIERPMLRAWLERPRGHSKTSDIAVMLAWVLFASRRRSRVWWPPPTGIKPAYCGTPCRSSCG